MSQIVTYRVTYTIRWSRIKRLKELTTVNSKCERIFEESYSKKKYLNSILTSAFTLNSALEVKQLYNMSSYSLGSQQNFDFHLDLGITTVVP